MRYIIHPYDTNKYDFVKLIQELLGTDNLQELNEKHDEIFKVGDDSKTSFHKKVYDKYRSGWWDMKSIYYQFIKEVIAPSFTEDFLFQSQPTWRFHLPNNLAVGKFHKDSEFNHPIGEINFVLPLTNSEGTASIWVESEPDKGDFEPMIMRVGELIEFNGNQLTHGNKINDTGFTRVSLDFRILPISCYNENEETGVSMTRSAKFKEGNYYTRFIHELDEVKQDLRRL